MTYFDELSQVLSRTDPAPLLDFVRECQGTLWLAGNGGSASNAQHWACDLSKAAKRRVQALGANPAVLTAYGNDCGYKHALRLELLYLWKPGDRLIALSCSGTSENIEQVMAEAGFRGMATAIVTGAEWENPYIYDVVCVNIPHTNYGIIEDVTMAIGHWLTEELQK